MNKVDNVFNKLAFNFEPFITFGKKYIKKAIKGDALKGTIPPIKNLQTFEALRGKINTPTAQRMLETQMNKTRWTGGVRPVTVLSKEELAKRVLIEKENRKLYGL